MGRIFTAVPPKLPAKNRPPCRALKDTNLPNLSGSSGVDRFLATHQLTPTAGSLNVGTYETWLRQR